MNFRLGRKKRTDLQMHDIVGKFVDQNVIRLEITMSSGREERVREATIPLFVRNIFEMQITNGGHELKCEKSRHIFVETRLGIRIGENEIEHVAVETFGDQQDVLVEVENTFELENAYEDQAAWLAERRSRSMQ